MLVEALLCVALNVYHEARSEPLEGQIAVAEVVMNRTLSDKYPDHPCLVITQGGEELYKCQFSWWCDGKPDFPKDHRAWLKSIGVAYVVMTGKWGTPVVDGSLFYHNDTVDPYWAQDMEVVSTIGHHIFLRENS